MLNWFIFFVLCIVVLLCVVMGIFFFGVRLALVDFVVVAEWIFLLIEVQVLLVALEMHLIEVPQLSGQLVFFARRVDLHQLWLF